MTAHDIPPTSYPASNALWVFDSHMREPRPATREEFIAWPAPAGDTAYTVNILNVVTGSTTRNFTYDVTVINP